MIILTASSLSHTTAQSKVVSSSCQIFCELLVRPELQITRGNEMTTLNIINLIFIPRSLCRLWPAEIWGLWYPAAGSYLCVLCKYFSIHIVSVHLSFSLKAPDFSFQDMSPMTQTSNFISLGLRFLIREIGMLVVSTSQGCFEDNWVNICKGLRAVVHSKG